MTIKIRQTALGNVAYDPTLAFEVSTDAGGGAPGGSGFILGSQLAAAFGGGGGGTSDDNWTVVTFTGGDQRADIQAAIGTPGARVKLEAGRVYEVDNDGQGYQFGRVTPIRACLVIASGVHFDLNGSTIRQRNSQNAVIMINNAITTNVGGGSTGPTVVDSNIVIENGTIDGNRANQSGSEDTTATPPFEEQGCLFMQSLDACIVRNMNINNSQCHGFRVFDARHCLFHDFYSEDVRGDAFAFGNQEINGVDQELFDCVIGDGVVLRAEGGYDFPNSARGAIQGNPWIGCFVRCVMGNWTSRNCAGGYKIENRTIDSAFGLLMWSGVVLSGESDLNTLNCGTKIQGFSGGRPRGVTIASVITDVAQGEALRITDSDYCSVKQVYGRACGTGTGINQTILVYGEGNHLGDVVVEDATVNLGIGIFIQDPLTAAVRGTTIDSCRFSNIAGAAVQVQEDNSWTSIGRLMKINSPTDVCINHTAANCVTHVHSIMSDNVVANNAGGGGTVNVGFTAQNLT